MSVLELLLLIWLHWFADFVLQTDKMAQRKSKDSRWLALHVLIYSACFVPFFGLLFGAATFLAHFWTDFATSRVTSWLWSKGERHWFFVVTGLDQALHLMALVITLDQLR